MFYMERGSKCSAITRFRAWDGLGKIGAIVGF